MEAITYSVTPIGKYFANSKLKHTWKFSLNRTFHEINLKVSHSTSKVKLWLDNSLILKSLLNFQSGFSTEVNVSGTILKVAQVNNDFDLFYNNTPFASFYPSNSHQQSFSNQKIQNENSIPIIPTKNLQNNLLRGIIAENCFFTSPFTPGLVFPSSPKIQSFNQQIPQKNEDDLRNSLLKGILDSVNENYRTSNPDIPNIYILNNLQKMSVDTFFQQPVSSQLFKPILISASCKLENLADNFLEIDFPTKSEKNFIIYASVHSMN